MQKDSKDNIKQELQQLGSSLQKEGTGKEFRVPDNYFEALPGIIQDKVLQKNRLSAQQTVWVVYRKAITVSAIVLLLAGVGIGLFYSGSNDRQDYISAEEIAAEIDYLAYHSAFDHSLLEDIVGESDLTPEEILYGLETGHYEDIEDMDEYDEVIEEMYEEAKYYGIESDYLLSSLD
ncbi:MAG: hypothetical protein R6U62_07190 [Bacteroidales bacterium]